MYDLLLYQKVLDDGIPCVLLEHDRLVTSDLIKLLKRYKIRKKVIYNEESSLIQKCTYFCCYEKSCVDFQKYIHYEKKV